MKRYLAFWAIVLIGGCNSSDSPKSKSTTIGNGGSKGGGGTGGGGVASGIDAGVKIIDNYINNTDGTVTDKATGLMWMRCTVGQEGGDCERGDVSRLPWQQAIDYCDKLSLAGYDDWRLPEVDELTTIVDYEKEETPRIDLTVFPRTPPIGVNKSTNEGYGTIWFWSSTSSACSVTTPKGWQIALSTGLIVTNNKTVTNSARCVRGGALERKPFEFSTISEERVVIDPSTKLMWQGCPAGDSGNDCNGSKLPNRYGATVLYNEEQAVDYCNASSYAGYDDWRLPSIVELISIINYSVCNPAIDKVAFPGFASTYFVSSSLSSPDHFWDVNFDTGTLGDTFEKATAVYSARCVRSSEGSKGTVSSGGGTGGSGAVAGSGGRDSSHITPCYGKDGVFSGVGKDFRLQLQLSVIGTGFTPFPLTHSEISSPGGGWQQIDVEIPIDDQKHFSWNYRPNNDTATIYSISGEFIDEATATVQLSANVQSENKVYTETIDITNKSCNTDGIGYTGAMGGSGGTGYGGSGGVGGNGTSGTGGKAPKEPTIPPISEEGCPVFATGPITIPLYSSDISISFEVGQKVSDPTAPMVFYTTTGSLGMGMEEEYTTKAPSLVQSVTSEGGIFVSFQHSGGVSNNCGYSDLADYKLVDRIVACAVKNYNIDPHRIYATGCGLGGELATCLATIRSSYFAAVALNSIVLTQSDGLQFNTPYDTPALMTMHGAPDTDVRGIDSLTTSARIDRKFKDRGAFVINCNHGRGYCEAPAEAYQAAWEFFVAHPFGVNHEPYAAGLPSTFPTYCTIY